MTQDELGKIEKIDLREAWEHEAHDFTDWLSQEDNLDLLSDEIGIDINLIETESSVGHFNVDIFAEDQANDEKIIIENQLEATDHDHLGKVITYASGLDAGIILWIVKEGQEEHRQAVDWLNNHTDEDLNFFLIKIELWQIESSPPAPKFDIISKPNDWAKAVRRSAKESQLTETKLMQRDFWEEYRQYAKDNGVPYSLQKARPQHWYNISIGSSGVHIALKVNTRDNTIGCEIYIRDDNEMFDFLQDHKEEIEQKLDEDLTWMPLLEKQASRIKAERNGVLENEDEWEEYFEWLVQTSKKFYKVFREELREYE